jgi:NADPH2:quinone reductase
MARIVDRQERQVNKPRVTSPPASMQAVVADGAGGRSLVERPHPVAGPGEVLVKGAAAGVNRPDILQRRGMYPPPPGAPDVLGLEIAGDVINIGSGSDALLRQKDSALVRGGGLADNGDAA